MSKVAIRFETDEKTKRALQAYAKKLGTTPSKLLNKQIHELLAARQPAESEVLEPNDELIEIMERVEEDIKHGYRNMTGPLNKEEALEHLRSMMHDD